MGAQVLARPAVGPIGPLWLEGQQMLPPNSESHYNIGAGPSRRSFHPSGQPRAGLVAVSSGALKGSVKWYERIADTEDGRKRSGVGRARVGHHPVG